MWTRLIKIVEVEMIAMQLLLEQNEILWWSCTELLEARLMPVRAVAGDVILLILQWDVGVDDDRIYFLLFTF